MRRLAEPAVRRERAQNVLGDGVGGDEPVEPAGADAAYRRPAGPHGAQHEIRAVAKNVLYGCGGDFPVFFLRGRVVRDVRTTSAAVSKKAKH